MKSRDIIAQIKADLAATKPSGKWFHKLNKEQRELVDMIAKAWVAGELGPAARPVAPAIAKQFRQAGVNVTPYTVREWLGDLKRS